MLGPKKKLYHCTGSNWEIRSEVVLNPAAFRVGVGYHGRHGGHGLEDSDHRPPGPHFLPQPQPMC